MTNKNTVGDLIIDYYNRNRSNDIIVNPENNDVTFRDFLKMDFTTEAITFTEQELEVSILYSSRIKIDEIVKVFHITQLEFENIFYSLKDKISSPKFCSKKYIADRIRKIFPNEICYKILNKYNLTEKAVKRHGISPKNKYISNEYKNISDTYMTAPEILFSNLLKEILILISSKIPQKQLAEIINSIKISQNN